MKLGVAQQAPMGPKADRTLTDIAAAELGEFVTGLAVFVNRQPRRNGTLCRRRLPANLQLAKNGRNKWIRADSFRSALSRRYRNGNCHGSGAPPGKGSVRRGWRDAVMSIAGLVIVLLVLFNFDSRVREQVQLRLSAPSAMVSDASHTVRNVAGIVTDALREHSLDGTSLLVFVVGAGALLLFMLRT